MVNRRDLLVGGLTAGVTAAGLGIYSNKASANWGMPTPVSPFDGRLLVNKPRAFEVLDREGLDGLVALNPVNVFYLGNYLGYFVKIQTPHPSFAVFPRAEDKPSVLVVANADLWQIANGDREYPEIIPYSARPENWEIYSDSANWESEPQPGIVFGEIWPWRHDTLSSREADWAAIEEKYKDQMAASPEYALVHALKEAGLDKSKIAVDDMRIANVLDNAGLSSVTCVEGDNIFRKIRMVKSDVEIMHMRNAARANQAAAMETLARLQPGATNADIEQLFMQEAANQGAKATWLVAGTTGGLQEGEIKSGQPFLFDTVSQVNYYHGDFGRTVVFGEPSRKLQLRAELLRLGWQAAFEAMKPGVSYSQVQKAARQAMKKSGLPQTRIGVTPHSVGLQHTDEPYRDGLPFLVKDDLILQENMILTVDFPSYELGWGTCHLEDLVVVTKDGAKPLANMGDSLVVL